MLTSNPAKDPETQRRQALARVYALLISLAEEKESANAQAVETKDPKEAIRGVQSKNSKRKILPNSGSQGH